MQDGGVVTVATGSRDSCKTSIRTSFDSMITTSVRSPKRILIIKGTVRLLYTLSFQGLEKSLNSSGQAVLIFYLPGATSCLYHVMILLEDKLPGPLDIGQVSFNLPSKKIHLSRTTVRAFLRALVWDILLARGPFLLNDFVRR